MLLLIFFSDQLPLSIDLHIPTTIRDSLSARSILVPPHRQYMRPTKKHMAVSDYVTPEAFAGYQKVAEDLGFLYAAAGPIVRSSYRAGEFYLTNVLKKKKEEEATA